MSGNTIKREVLRAFKQLHYTRRKVFRDDIHALSAARQKINEEFKKNKSVVDQGAINEMVTFAKAVEHELRTSVLQAVETKPGTYEVRITEDTMKLDNVPFDDCKLDAEESTNKRKEGSSPCSGETVAPKKENKKTNQSGKGLP